MNFRAVIYGICRQFLRSRSVCGPDSASAPCQSVRAARSLKSSARHAHVRSGWLVTVSVFVCWLVLLITKVCVCVSVDFFSFGALDNHPVR